VRFGVEGPEGTSSAPKETVAGTGTGARVRGSDGTSTSLSAPDMGSSSEADENSSPRPMSSSGARLLLLAPRGGAARFAILFRGMSCGLAPAPALRRRSLSGEGAWDKGGVGSDEMVGGRGFGVVTAGTAACWTCIGADMRAGSRMKAWSERQAVKMLESEDGCWGGVAGGDEKRPEVES
jgi:hypothetical protein